MIKRVTAGLVAGAVVVLGLVWAVVFWPDEAYDYGYARAFQTAWSTWALAPDDGLCVRLVSETLREHPDYRPESVFGGCVDGYRDGVNYRRVPLGLEPR